MKTHATTGVSRLPLGDEGIHLAIDLSQGSALTWVAGELAVALADIGQRVSIPRTASLSPTLEDRLRPRLAGLMTDRPCRTCHVKLNHYWPQFLMQEVSGEINAELFVTNYRFRGDMLPLDMWSRNLVANGIRKLPLSSFSAASLQDLGVPSDRCAVVAPGYSPEIETLFPTGRPRADDRVRRLLVVTNSHDLDRYGTDLLVPAIAKAYGPHDPVEIHIKDYGASSGRRRLREMVAAQPSFPTVVWHERFLGKEDLIRLYGAMHLMVSPFRGEGYAMKIIDAMAVGLPVMMPAFGGPLEYSPAGGFLPLEFDEVPVGACYDTEHYLVGPGAYWCEVREESLVASLRSYLDDPAVAESAAATARAHVFGRYTWKNAAVALASAVHEWHAERSVRIASRQRPATLPLSVIMPTKDRPAELAKTLAGYAAQRDDGFEILVVNDHGNGQAVRRIVASFDGVLRTRVLDNDGPPGPGAARNLAIEAADGEIFLITGDDIIPAPDLVARHRDAHRRHPDVEDAFVGRVEWHPDMPCEWFTGHIVGDGCQQFNFQSLRDGQEAPYDRFYTSNISWKRSLTADLEQVFSESFRYAAFEDVELGYRLSNRGLRLRYLANAVGHHLHPMTVRSFLERMRRVGSMRTVLTAMHPRLVGSEGLRFYEDLEVERRHRSVIHPPGSSVGWESIVEPSVTAFGRLDERAASGGQLTGAAASLVEELERRVVEVRRTLFDDLCETFVQVGQAQEWARESPDEQWAAEWVAMLRLARRHAGSRQAAEPSATEPKGLATLKHALLRFACARNVREWLRRLKRRRRCG